MQRLSKTAILGNPHHPLFPVYKFIQSREFTKAIDLLSAMDQSREVLKLTARAYTLMRRDDLALVYLYKLKELCKTRLDLAYCYGALSRSYGGLYLKTGDKKYLIEQQKLLPLLEEYKGIERIDFQIILTHSHTDIDLSLQLIEDYLGRYRNNRNAYTNATNLKMKLLARKGETEEAKKIARNMSDNIPEHLSTRLMNSISNIDRTIVHLDFDKEFAACKSDPDSLSKLGFTLQNLKMAKEADEVYQYAMATFLYDWRFYLEYAYFLGSGNDYTGAIPYLIKITEAVESSNPHIRPSTQVLLNAYKSLALLYFEINNFAQSRMCIKKGLDIDANNPSLLSLQAKVSVDAKSMPLYEQARVIAPKRFATLHPGARAIDTKILIEKSADKPEILITQEKPAFDLANFPPLPSKAERTPLSKLDEFDSIKPQLKPLKKDGDLAKAINKRILKKIQKASYYPNACTLFAIAGTVVCAGFSLYAAKMKFS